MAYKTVASPSCPYGHARAQVHSDGQRSTKRGTTRKWRCRYVEEDGDTYQHYFCTSDAGETTRELLDRAVLMPTCGMDAHEDWRIDTTASTTLS